ncbi:MAG: hypothetical protein J5J00_14640 [Deltaproteobacteria bacterium]|nr:hypothetical protein [Deltaproteobacteria bacterium]
MKIGIISSSGGSIIHELLSIPELRNRHEFVVVTDRACGTEEVCRQHQIPSYRIEEDNNYVFGEKLGDYLATQGEVRFLLLLFVRVISQKIHSQYFTFNIHPSLLPAFKGFNALKSARLSNVRFLGATLHLVTDEIDEGPIIAQVCAPVALGLSHSEMQKISFIQKTYLSLLLLELMETNELQVKESKPYFSNPTELLVTANACPALRQGPYLEAIKNLEQTSGIDVFGATPTFP